MTRVSRQAWQVSYNGRYPCTWKEAWQRQCDNDRCQRSSCSGPLKKSDLSPLRGERIRKAWHMHDTLVWQGTGMGGAGAPRTHGQEPYGQGVLGLGPVWLGVTGRVSGSGSPWRTRAAKARQRWSSPTTVGSSAYAASTQANPPMRARVSLGST